MSSSPRAFASTPTLDTERKSLFASGGEFSPSRVVMLGHTISIDIATGNVVITREECRYPYHRMALRVHRRLDVQRQYMRDVFSASQPNVDPRPGLFGNWQLDREVDIDEVWLASRCELQLTSSLLNAQFGAEGTPFRRLLPDAAETERLLRSLGVSRQSMDTAQCNPAGDDSLLRSTRGRFLLLVGRHQEERLTDPPEVQLCVFDPARGDSWTINTEARYDTVDATGRAVGPSSLIAQSADVLGHRIRFEPVGEAPFRHFSLSDDSTLPDGTNRRFLFHLGHEQHHLDGDDPRRTSRSYLVTTVTDASKADYNVFTYQYDEKHRLRRVILPTSIAAPGSRWIKYEYDDAGFGQLTAITNQRGETIRLEYTTDVDDNDNRLNPRLKIKRLTDPEGNYVRYSHDSRKQRVVTEVGRNGVSSGKTTHQYLRDHQDTNRRYITTSTTEVTRGAEVDHNNQIVGRDPDNPQVVVTRTAYSDDGRYNIVKQFDGLGRFVEFEYNDFNQITKRWDYARRWVEYEYALPEMPTPERPLQFDLIRQRTQAKVRRRDTEDPAEFVDTVVVRVDEHRYVSFGPETSEHPTDYGVQSTHRIAHSRMLGLEQVGSPERRLEYGYDDADSRSMRPSLIRSPSGVVTQTTFNDRGEDVTFVNGLQQVALKSFNDQGRVVGVRDVDGKLIQLTYSPCGNWLQKLIDTAGGTVEFVRDAGGRVDEVRDQVGDSVRYTYHGNGRLAAIHRDREPVPADPTDPTSASRIQPYAGLTTRLEYTPRGSTSRIVNQRGLALRIAYDEMERKVGWSYGVPGAQSRQFVYDAAGQLVGASDRLGRVSLIDYDESGFVRALTLPPWEDDAGEAVAGKVIDYLTYDFHGRVLDLRDSEFEGVKRFMYDMSGKLKVRRDADSFEVVFSHDLDGRLVGVANRTVGYEVNYELDALSRVVRTEDSQIFDGANRWLYRYEDHSGPQSRWSFLFHRRNDSTGQQSRFDYDDRSRMTGLRHFRTGEDGHESTQFHSQLDYRDDNLLLGRRGSEPNAFLYDGLKQIIYEHVGNVSFDYDEVGNRLFASDVDVQAEVSWNQYDEVNQILQDGVGGGQYTHSANGEVLSRQRNTSADRYYYDGQGKVRIAVAGGARINYLYDEGGRLVKRWETDLVSGALTVTDFHYLLNKPYLVRVNGQVERVLTWDSAGLLLRVRRPQQLDSSLSFPHSLYPQTNELGDVVIVHDSGGAVRCRFAYDAWGNQSGADPGGVWDLFGFRSGLHDRASGLHYFSSRWYSSRIGRWMSEDPATSIDGHQAGEMTNLYRFAMNNPVYFSDPSGLASEAAQRADVVIEFTQTRPIIGDPNADMLTPEYGQLAFLIGPDEYRDWFHESTFHNVFVPLAGNWGITAVKGLFAGAFMGAGEALIEFGLVRGGLLGVSSNATKAALSETVLSTSVSSLKFMGNQLTTLLVKELTGTDDQQGDITKQLDMIDVVGTMVDGV